MLSGCRLAGAIAGGVALAAVSLSPGARAQTTLPSIQIGTITSEKACTVYQESAGRSSLVATGRSIVAVDSWRTWLVKDCVDNFATIRTSLQAALASTGKFNVLSGKGASYTLSGAISQVGGDPNAAPVAPDSEGGVSISSRQIFVTMEVTLRDASGRIVYGGLLTKHLETGSNIHTRGLSTSSGQSGEALYAELEDQVALAIGRLVAFRIVPLQVVANDGQQIRLNYGSPFLTLGTIVHATSPDHGATVRYVVTASDPNGSSAEVDGQGDTGRILVGSLASVIEADDPTANERRIKRVELP